MEWALPCTLAVVVAWLAVRLRRVERDLRSLAATTHDAANRALRRHGRDRWRWRETDGVLRRIARETLPYLDLPDLLAGPPDDSSDSEV